MSEKSSQQGEHVEACPECESSSIHRRSPLQFGDAERFKCQNCGAVFAEPLLREPKKVGGNYSDIGNTLREADPDDLVTDGGRVESEKQVAHTVEYLTGREVARIDADPVLDRHDFWRGDQA